MAKKLKNPTSGTVVAGGGKTLDNQSVTPIVTAEKTVKEKLKFPEGNTKPLSCVSGNAMIEFGTGNAPVLDYEIPQKTSFSAYGTNELTPLFASETPPTETDIFMPKAFEEPVIPPVSIPATTTGIIDDIVHGTGVTVINTTKTYKTT